MSQAAVHNDVRSDPFQSPDDPAAVASFGSVACVRKTISGWRTLELKLRKDHQLSESKLFERRMPHELRGQGLHQAHIVGQNARQTLPEIISLAGVLDAVVLDDSALSPEGARLLCEIATKWKD